MDRRAELIRQFKEMETEAGVYQIRNTTNDKIFVESSPNFKNINGRTFELNIGSHLNKELQKDWTELGEEMFVFEVLEIVEKKKSGYFDLKDALKKMERKWLDRLQPYGDKGYNKPPRA
ncbi:GIY-YIG nuclease family protein [Paenibacillus chitinolyticus]|uniref:GIY-YIG nuclease family protein n=1 Tax=Paenibacillus chitinolyticus TaxID=79263 RepID=UPI002DB6999C|nr:GIY-YIG nuclease family protein [Paenibacillus chitinolyticus]MEC0246863.1 GIY-YIG nuclease family protein [Paenibacillus chitinolyticus]